MTGHLCRPPLYQIVIIYLNRGRTDRLSTIVRAFNASSVEGDNETIFFHRSR